MNLRDLCRRFFVFFLVIQCLCTLAAIGCVVVVERRSAKQRVCDQLYTIYESINHELAGNLLLGHPELVEHHLAALRRRHDVAVALTSAGFTVSDAALRRPSLKSTFPVEYAGQHYGTLTLSKPAEGSHGFKTLALVLIIVQAGFWGFAACFLYIWALKCVVRPVQGLAEAATSGFVDGLPGAAAGVPSEIVAIGRRLADAWRAAENQTQAEAFARVSKQVAHDIRSPLAALQVISGTCTTLQDEHRLLVQHACARVQDIANNLLTFGDSRAGASVASTSSTVLVVPLLESIVSEKRCEYRRHLSLSIDLRICAGAVTACVKVNRAELARVLSNLINNAAEACQYRGDVVLGLAVDGAGIRLSVTDSGPGMTRETLNQLRRAEVRSTKAGGHGLGLRHAFQFAAGTGGRMDIESEYGHGACFALVLPRCSSPSWLPTCVTVPTGAVLMVVDDEVSAHQLWRTRCPSGTWQDHGIDLLAVSCGDDLERALLQRDFARPLRILCDQHFAGSEETGLALFKRLDVAAHSILVTSHHDDATVQATCEKSGIGLVPKALAAKIPVEIDKEVEMDDEEYRLLVTAPDGSQRIISMRANTLDAARREASTILQKSRETAVKVTVLEGRTGTHLGSIQAGAVDAWEPSPHFPICRMTWH